MTISPSQKRIRKPTGTEIIGITGGLATGKSTVSALLRRSGYFVIDTDAIAHDVVKPHQKAFRQIVEAFGQAIISKDGTIDRDALAQLVFINKTKRKELEAIVHPEVKKAVKNIIDILKKQKPRLIFLEVPLLFETDFHKLCHQTVCVTSSQSHQLERARTKRHMSRSQALARIRAQMSLSKKCKRADFVIENNAGKKELTQKIKIWLKALSCSW
ncbi:MAG: hypothetical protein ACD_62C00511G0002 [uncultured bacterium]|nr:MAG: hypothetical protein ACD_62C00511G0002 [uncultured bacterium]HLD45920.1 dephospho-CoA kinase [bacterium]